jgi:hypothetical protein
LVRILEVERFALDEARVAGGELSSPAPGEGSGRDVGAGPGFELEFSGWVEGRDLPVRAVHLVQDAMVLSEIEPAGEGSDGGLRTAFYAPLSAIPLPREFEVVVRVELAGPDDGSRFALAAVRGRRSELRTDVKPRINPLMVTTFSRTGSNLFLRTLSVHPEVVVYRPFEYEPRVGAYWVDVLRELTEPASYRRQITPQGRQSARGWWLGVGSPMPPPLADPEIEEAIALDAVSHAARFCQEQIERVYGRIASMSGRGSARYFAEKVSPNAVPSIMCELYANAREIFLVRDFRDMIASVLAANARRGGLRFGRQPGDTDERFVRRFRSFATNLAAAWRRRAERAHLVRYEDLLRRPHETVAALVEYLDLETTDETLAAMVGSLRLREEGLEEHITSGSPEASIGRWRSDLAPELQRLADEVFAPALEVFGYERAEHAESSSRRS